MTDQARDRMRAGQRRGTAVSIERRRAMAAAGAAFARAWPARMQAWLNGSVRSGDPAIQNFVRLYGKDSANG